MRQDLCCCPSSSKIIERLFKNIANVENRAKRTYANLVKQMQGKLQFSIYYIYYSS